MKWALSLGMVVGAVASQAAQFALFNTGVDDLGTQLADGALDSHWMVEGVGQASVLSSGNTWYEWPYPTDAKWVAPYDLWQVPYGSYDFVQTFDLTGFDPSTAKITGSWAADQYGSIFLNDEHVTDLGDGNWRQLNPFEITGHFAAGINVLKFSVMFPDGGDGLIVSGLQGTAEPVPEPVTALALCAGLAALVRRRR